MTYASIFLLTISLVSLVLLLARTRNAQDTQVESNPTAQAEAASIDSPTFKNIEDLQLGDRTLGKNPKEVFPAETDDSVFERIPHCAYSLCYVKDDGSRCDVKLLRPENWLEKEETDCPKDVINERMKESILKNKLLWKSLGIDK